jgi:multiple sugar transport system substrate-binding protein
MQRGGTSRRNVRTRANALVCVLVLAAALLAAGCGAAADGPLPHPGGAASAIVNSAPRLDGPLDRSKISGEVIMFSGTSPWEAKITRHLVANFEKKNPNVHVKFTSINRDYPTVVLTRYAAGDAPDVLTVDGKFMSDWSSKGLLMPLDGFMDAEHVDRTRWRGPLMDSVKGPGSRTYALPLNYSTVALYVNDRMLADAGVDHVPTNWEELEAAAKAVTKHEGSRSDRAGLCLVPSWERMLLFALQQGGGITDVDGTKMLIRSKGTRTALDWVRHMLDTGAAISPDAAGAQWCGDAFGRGNVAMALEGAWMLPPMHRQYPDVQFSVHELPVGERAATLAYSGNMAISRTSKNPGAAWMLLDYLASPEAQAEVASLGLAVPAQTGVAYPDKLKVFADGIDYATVWSLPPGFFNTVLVAADNEMSAVLEGKQSVDGMLGEVQKIGDTMLAAGGTRS